MPCAKRPQSTRPARPTLKRSKPTPDGDATDSFPWVSDRVWLDAYDAKGINRVRHDEEGAEWRRERADAM